ncbi:hypothetical protein GIB67_030440 [Kingdonia uniflora]|uniref:Uncharacterized protein n=1 Tax=Kingdonia uniflora TaxID=39325 RepID=A0A7J7NEG4_9MAGN|nr:hypothetical protein GIB67_030440 [Kingdonia uniflora]
MREGSHGVTGVVDGSIEAQKVAVLIVLPNLTRLKPKVIDEADRESSRAFAPQNKTTGDRIFFDTYGEYYEDLREFHQHLPSLLKPGGIYSYFNGLCGGNAFFHVVYCQLVSLELRSLGYSTQFVNLPVKDCLGEEVWEGVKHKYWQLDTYYLPVCQYSEDSE